MPNPNELRGNDEQRRRIMNAVNEANAGREITGKPPRAGGCDGETSRYDQALAQIMAGAEKLKSVTGEDPATATYDDNGFGQRVTNGAFCLRMAYQLWIDVYQREEQEKNDRLMREQMHAQGGGMIPNPGRYGGGMPGIGMALLGGGAGMGKMKSVSPLKQVRRRTMSVPDELMGAGEDPMQFAAEVGKETLAGCLKLCAEAGIKPDEIGQMMEMYKTHYQAVQKEKEQQAEQTHPVKEQPASTAPCPLDRSET